MQLDNYEIKWDVENDTFYLTIALGSAQIDEYLLQMLTTNQIAGLIPVRRQSIDGEVSLRYEIGDLQKIGDTLNGEQLDERAQKAVFKSLIQTQKLLPEYFLGEAFCVFDKNFVFLDNRFCVKLLCLPLDVTGSESVGELQEFLKDIINTWFSGYMIGSQNNYVGRIAQAVNKDKLSIDQLFSVAECEDEPEVNEIIKPRAEIPVMPPVIQGAKKAVDNYIGEAKKAIDNYDDSGFKIPGMEENGEEEKKKKGKDTKGKAKGGKPKKEPKEKPEKKSGIKLGGLFRKGKETEEQPQPAEPAIPTAGQIAKEFNMTVNVDKNDPFAPKKKAEKEDVDIFERTSPMEMPVRKAPRAALVNGNEIVEINRNPFLIGRVQCDMVIDSIYVSHNHARITLSDGEYYIEDLNSKNRTSVDAVPLTPYTKHKLSNGVQLIFADRIYTFTLGD